jgi:hypothetical protein
MTAIGESRRSRRLSGKTEFDPFRTTTSGSAILNGRSSTSHAAVGAQLLNRYVRFFCVIGSLVLWPAAASAQDTSSLPDVQISPGDIHVTVRPFEWPSADEFNPGDKAAIEIAWKEFADRVESGEIRTLMVFLIPYNVNTGIAFVPGMIIDNGFLNCRLVLSDSDRTDLLNAIRTTSVLGSRNNQVVIKWGVQFLNSNGTIVNTLELSRRSEGRVSSFLSETYTTKGAYVNSRIIDWLESRVPSTITSFDAPRPRNCG